MATRLAQLAALLDGLDRNELSYLSSYTSKRLRETVDSTRCFLLELPAELRDHIYHYVAMNHLRKADNTNEMPNMMQVNKQVRTEFRDVYYGKSIVEIRYSPIGEQKAMSDWDLITDRTEISRVLRIGTADVRATKASAEQSIKWLRRHLKITIISTILIHEVWRDGGSEEDDCWRKGTVRTSALGRKKADL